MPTDEAKPTELLDRFVTDLEVTGQVTAPQRSHPSPVGTWTVDPSDSSVSFAWRRLRLWTITGRLHCMGVIQLDGLPPVGVIRFQQPSGLPVLTMALDPRASRPETPIWTPCFVAPTTSMRCGTGGGRYAAKAWRSSPPAPGGSWRRSPPEAPQRWSSCALRSSRGRAAPTRWCCVDGGCWIDAPSASAARPGASAPRSSSTWPYAPIERQSAPASRHRKGKRHEQPACWAEPGAGHPAHHPTAPAGRPCATAPGRSPAPSPPHQVGGPSLVAAGPLATHRHQAASPSPTHPQLTDREATMSKLTRTLIIGATLAAMHLAGMTAVAQAQANDEPVIATTHRTPSRGGLAPPPGRIARADRRGRRPPAGAGPRALLHPQPNTRPDTCPRAPQAEQTARPAHRLAGCADCRPGVSGWAGLPSCQEDQASGSA